MRLALVTALVTTAAALQFQSQPTRRGLLCTGAAALGPLFAARGSAQALTEYVKKDFKDGVYVGPPVVGAAPTAEGEVKLEQLYFAALEKQEATVKAMGFELDEADRLEVEMLVRTQYCGFQAKLKCKGSPAAKGGQSAR